MMEFPNKCPKCDSEILSWICDGNCLCTNISCNYEWNLLKNKRWDNGE